MTQAQIPLTWTHIVVERVGQFGVQFQNQWYGVNNPLTPHHFQVGQTYQVGLKLSKTGKMYIAEAPALTVVAGSATAASPQATLPPRALPTTTPPAAPIVPPTTAATIPPPGGLPPITPPQMAKPFTSNAAVPITVSAVPKSRETDIHKQVALKAAIEFVKSKDDATPESVMAISDVFHKYLEA